MHLPANEQQWKLDGKCYFSGQSARCIIGQGEAMESNETYLVRSTKRRISLSPAHSLIFFWDYEFTETFVDHFFEFERTAQSCPGAARRSCEESVARKGQQRRTTIA